MYENTYLHTGMELITMQPFRNRRPANQYGKAQRKIRASVCRLRLQVSATAHGGDEEEEGGEISSLLDQLWMATTLRVKILETIFVFFMFMTKVDQ
jgi:hypothetical protein